MIRSKSILLILLFFAAACRIPEKKEDFVTELSVSACGDVLFYDGNYRHFNENGSLSDFYEITASVAGSVQLDDIAIVNQETPTAGREFGISGYPFFNAPFEMVDALRKTGFDVFGTANNHSLDRGRAGIEAAVGYYRKTGALFVGTAAGGEDPLQPLVLLVKDISVALFSVTDITNIAYPDPSPVANTSDRIRLRDRIADASGKYDFVIVMLHYGDEYTTEPRTSDRALVGSLIEAGVDVVFGNHAHVIRAFERFDSPKGGDAFVFWGLGNFIGWMGHRPECSVGGIFRVVLRVTEKADGLRLLSVNDPSVELTYSVNRGREHRTLFLRDAAPFSDDAPRLFETVSALLKSRDSRITVF